MIYGLYQSAAGMMVNEYRQGVIANNLANAETSGFKRDLAVFSERLPARMGGHDGAGAEKLDALTGGLWLGRTDTDFSPTSIVSTGQPTDAAIDGPGFFMVGRDGRQYATRDGRFVVDAVGNLRSAADGAAVLGFGGAPLRVRPQGGPISISEDGRIDQDGVTVGRLALIDFADYRGMRKAEAGRFHLDGRPTRAVEARIVGGAVENSGVEAVQEMVGMIEAARAHQFNAQMLSLQDQGLGRLLNIVSSI